MNNLPQCFSYWTSYWRDKVVFPWIGWNIWLQKVCNKRNFWLNINEVCNGASPKFVFCSSFSSYFGKALHQWRWVKLKMIFDSNTQRSFAPYLKSYTPDSCNCQYKFVNENSLRSHLHVNLIFASFSFLSVLRSTWGIFGYDCLIQNTTQWPFLKLSVSKILSDRFQEAIVAVPCVVWLSTWSHLNMLVNGSLFIGKPALTCTWDYFVNFCIHALQLFLETC